MLASGLGPLTDLGQGIGRHFPIQYRARLPPSRSSMLHCCFIFLSSSLLPHVPLHLSLTTDGDRIVSTRPQSQTKGFDKISILQTTYVQVLNGMGHLHCYFDVSTTYRPAICPLCIMSYTLWSSDRPTVLKGALMTPRRKNSMASELSLRLPT